MKKPQMPHSVDKSAQLAQDEKYMAAALRLGRTGLGLTAPNPSVACLIVRDGAIIGRGVTARGGRPHAEPQALAQAGEAARGATAYVTLEPCSHYGKTPPCSEALVKAGIARLVCALGDPDPRVEGRGFAVLRAAGIEVVENVLHQSAAYDHIGHILRVRAARPFVQLKMAVSQNGKIGRYGEKIALTSAQANAHVHLLRAKTDAIIIGIGTALNDDPLLTCRLEGMQHASPVRVVLDSGLHLPLTSQLVMSANMVPLHVFAAFGADLAKMRCLEACGVNVHLVSPSLLGAGLELNKVLRELVKLGITRVLLEGGARLAQAFLERDLIDEAIFIEAPIMVQNGVAALHNTPLTRITEHPDFTLRTHDHLGADLWSAYERQRG